MNINNSYPSRKKVAALMKYLRFIHSISNVLHKVFIYAKHTVIVQYRKFFRPVGAVALAATVFGACMSSAFAAPVAYVANADDGTVFTLDTSTNTIGDIIPTSGSSATHLAITPDKQFLYVALPSANLVSVIDTSTNTEVATIAVDRPSDIAVTPNGETAYVSNQLINTVTVIDTATNTVTGTITVQSAPAGIAINPSGNFAYATNNSSGTVAIIDTASNTIISNFSSGGGNPVDIAMTPDGSFAYVTNNASQTVGIIDTSVHSTLVVKSVSRASAVAVSPLGDFAYIVSSSNNAVSILDIAVQDVIKYIPLTGGVTASKVAFTPDGDFAYVTHNSDAISIIDTSTQTLISTLSITARPFDIVIVSLPDEEPIATFESLTQDINDSELSELRKNILVLSLSRTQSLLENHEVGTRPHRFGCFRMKFFKAITRYYAYRGLITQEQADDWKAQADSLREENGCS